MTCRVNDSLHQSIVEALFYFQYKADNTYFQELQNGFGSILVWMLQLQTTFQDQCYYVLDIQVGSIEACFTYVFRKIQY